MLEDEHLNLGRVRTQRPVPHYLTIADLAKEAGISRSVLADRFRHYLSEPPISYLTRFKREFSLPPARFRLESKSARQSRSAVPLKPNGIPRQTGKYQIGG